MRCASCAHDSAGYARLLSAHQLGGASTGAVRFAGMRGAVGCAGARARECVQMDASAWSARQSRAMTMMM